MKFPFQISTAEQLEMDYKKSISNPEVFWAEIASHFLWKSKWEKTLSWNFEQPLVQWFKGGILNITENALDRHAAITPNKTALIWEPNNPSEPAISFTYEELLIKVNQFAHVLKTTVPKKATEFVFICPWCPNWQ
jgi:acetyl-CoA synthetase